MRIGVDARKLIDGGLGIGRYCKNLFHWLGKIDTENEYILFFNKTDEYKPGIERLNFGKNFNKRFISSFGEATFSGKAYEQLLFPLTLRREGVELFYSPDFTAPLLRHCNAIATIHDLSFFRASGYFTKSLKLYHFWTRFSSKDVEKVIVPSQSTKNDLVDVFGLPQEKIRVIYEGIEEAFCPVDEEKKEKFRYKYKLNFDFIYYNSSIEPRKNILNLLRAYCKLKKRGIDHRLVFSGLDLSWASFAQDIQRTLIDSRLKESVVFLGYIPSNELPLLYNCSQLFVYPSFYEGFGLPPLEAMGCGVPVVTSNVSSLPEIVGDAAVLVNPHDVDELADAMWRVLVDGSLRKNLIEKGFRWVRRFSWEKTARQTLSLFNEVGS